MVAKKARMPYKKLALLSFYLEGAVANEFAPSRWWDREVGWRVQQMSLRPAAAEQVWSCAQPMLEVALLDQTTELTNHLSIPSRKQLSLI
jgi:hypothetical protein